MLSLNFFTIWLTFLGTRAAVATSPTVNTPWGDIEGINILDDHGNQLEAYLGIPFAVSPVGDLRFKKPVPHPGPNTTFNASNHGVACTQVNVDTGIRKVFGDEDCLTLNVYVPSSKVPSPRAVMVWIPGGGFLLGSASQYDPSPLATVGDVIVVTVQYRLGPFGFLTTMDDAAKGNYGLWDQLLAIKWIKKNIGGFGGDPDEITIIGESAGSGSVGFLTISPEAKGLFKRAIFQSGLVTSSWAIKRDPLPVTYMLGESVGCGTVKDDHPKLIDCIRSVSAHSLAYVSWPATNDYTTLLVIIPYAPVVDGEFVIDYPQTLLSAPERLSSSAFPNCDIMMGVNNNEGGDLYGGSVFDDRVLNTSLRDSLSTSAFYKTKLLPQFLYSVFGDYNSDMLDAAVFEYMFPKDVNSEQVDLQSVFNTKTDAGYLVPAVQFARAHASVHGTGKTYLYYFNHFPKWTLSPVESVARGMHHAFDLSYTFGFSSSIRKMSFASNISTAEVALSVTFRQMLTHFAKIGDPSGAIKHITAGPWSEYNTTTEEYLDFNDHMTVRNHLAPRRVALWLNLLPRLRHDNKVTTHKGTGGLPLIPLPNVFG